MTVTFVQHRIIDAVKDMRGIQHSDEGYITSIDAICKALPGYQRKDTVEAIGETEGVHLVDPPSGSIRISATYFKMNDYLGEPIFDSTSPESRT